MGGERGPGGRGPGGRGHGGRGDVANHEDDGGYATKPLVSGAGRVTGSAGQHFGHSGHGSDDFGGDFTKVDFDKPLFDIK